MRCHWPLWGDTRNSIMDSWKSCSRVGWLQPAHSWWCASDISKLIIRLTYITHFKKNYINGNILHWLRYELALLPRTTHRYLTLKDNGSSLLLNFDNFTVSILYSCENKQGLSYWDEPDQSLLFKTMKSPSTDWISPTSADKNFPSIRITRSTTYATILKLLLSRCHKPLDYSSLSVYYPVCEW